MATKDIETPQDTGAVPSGADVARANNEKLRGAEDNAVKVAERLHAQGKAEAAKHGG